MESRHTESEASLILMGMQSKTLQKKRVDKKRDLLQAPYFNLLDLAIKLS